MQEVRLLFSKEGRAVYISHLDVVRCFSRAINRAEIPVRYTQGFNPQPYLVFSPPLSLGYVGEAEVCDFAIEDDQLDVALVAELLGKTMPDGIRPRSSAAPVHKMGLLHSADYMLVLDAARDWAPKIEACLRRPEIVMLKKSKRRQEEVNIAPLIQNLSVEPVADGRITLSCRLAVVGENALNPRYVAEVLQRDLPGLPPNDHTVKRIGFFLENGMPFA